MCIALVAQWIEHQPSKLQVVRSSRTEGASEASYKLSKGIDVYRNHLQRPRIDDSVVVTLNCQITWCGLYCIQP
jgi:hypothetical protein